jgi:tetratricopeptide (TPR) repeat protein
MRGSIRISSAALLLTLLLAAPVPPGRAAESPREALARAQELLDAERPEEALEVLAEVPRGASQARVMLLRSTARFMLGQTDAGRRDLDRALDLDPGLRQGWLNRAALDIAEERYDQALAALRKAEELDPGAPENDLNIGAVLLLSGELSQASERFRRYLAGPGASAQGYYLVASNYASSGYTNLAVEHLRRAIELEERLRLQARSDPNFVALAEDEAFRRLMDAEPQPPPPGAYLARRHYPEEYAGGQGPLLPAVLDALQLGGVPFDPRVEVTPAWALIWGELRIVVRTAPDDQGLVEVSAPADRFTPEGWRQRTEELFRRIQTRLATAAGMASDSNRPPSP